MYRKWASSVYVRNMGDKILFFSSIETSVAGFSGLQCGWCFESFFCAAWTARCAFLKFFCLNLIWLYSHWKILYIFWLINCRKCFKSWFITWKLVECLNELTLFWVVIFDAFFARDQWCKRWEWFFATQNWSKQMGYLHWLWRKAIKKAGVKVLFQRKISWESLKSITWHIWKFCHLLWRYHLLYFEGLWIWTQNLLVEAKALLNH